MNEIKYPTPYEIQEVLNSFLKRNFVDSFSQSMGVFFINARQENVSKSLSHILYDKKDVDILRANAYQTVSRHALSGFSLKSSLIDFSLQEIYENIRDNDKHLHSKGYRLNSLIKISNNIMGTSSYKGSLEYIKKKPGRIEFLDKEKGFSEFYLIDVGNGEWQVEVDGNKSSDGKEVLKLITSITDKNTTHIIDINIDSIKDRTTIEFFDELAKIGLGNDWSFIDVKHLAFKRNRFAENEEEENDNEEDESIEKEQLTGISQAILEGRNLREDPFVIQYEEKGYIFTAMTYEFENRNTPETIQLRAEFKGNPKIFEVSIISYKKTKGLTAKKESEVLTPDKHREIRSLFWNNAKKVYIELKDEDG
jgi:hypothetical protein